MIHYQELIPEKASWGLNSGFGDVRTPIKIYTVWELILRREARG